MTEGFLNLFNKQIKSNVSPKFIYKCKLCMFVHAFGNLSLQHFYHNCSHVNQKSPVNISQNVAVFFCFSTTIIPLQWLLPLHLLLMMYMYLSDICQDSCKGNLHLADRKIASQHAILCLLTTNCNKEIQFRLLDIFIIYFCPSHMP